ncbi:exopolyphosphatase-like enzyme [Schinkia azotoformans MEV2011]|uniref:Exopolyphosphatase-like enzyme n=1 Tax=Schinkia azotoformans MEV2011 TaxID=1348973 RepID=A0A072NQ55_SCHAZ|nr:bifunctional oligoribonuclease/PAP phosphatase NrnA [Schinkia azotoformans]KEF39581.1 exopolyphosphatase-like enzyme [Schinkia azotoformans MEV2011]MEC1694271.1 bifunctional oligoribonuclease/PAP phosphatase NrnA [Schinkia azotoformans]MEC1714928.1 bifunctional oligoribonuclease/PAP phosphatase NrnA [Schinkia azotoformans]MEC1720469.1 bifunctional oligoribonuclease/PAP phosphatase NrnA [Schinkia azotoformans]MEC1723515.1 bifunctional oligoribonuclease/PAP phosphatase NrnA [Schinkia azotofor
MKAEIVELIKSYERIIVHRHVRPDPDAIGSQGGLAEMIKASFPEKEVYVVGETYDSLLFLNEMDSIPDDYYKGALVIVCDTANQERISDNRYKLGEKLVKIDHHPNHDPYGDLLWVDTTSSSTSELMYELFLFGKDKGLKLNEKAARLLFAGIVGDTGRFLFPSTNIKTFRYAADLLEYKFDPTSLYDQLYNTTAEVVHLQGYILQNFKHDPSGVAYISITKEMLEKFNVTPTDASQLVSLLGNIENVLAWVFFVEEKNEIRVRLRSRGPIINTIAGKYNGGGHPLASGATIYNWDETEAIIKDLEDACLQYKKQ